MFWTRSFLTTIYGVEELNHKCSARSDEEVMADVRTISQSLDIEVLLSHSEDSILVNIDHSMMLVALQRVVFFVVDLTCAKGSADNKVQVNVSKEGGVARIQVCTSGLGLKALTSATTVTTTVLELHSGSVTQLSHIQGSAGWQVCIPLYSPHLESTATPVASSSLSTLTTSAKLPPISLRGSFVPRNYLIIDDSPMCRRMVIKQLKSNGISCSEAENGWECVCIVKAALEEGRTIDCILMDNSMPVLRGVSATRILREFGYSGKIYGVTGNVLQRGIQEFLESGADMIFSKPLKSEDYVAIAKCCV